MKAAAAISPGVVRAVDVPQPEYGEYEALCRTVACGFCNSTDMKIIEGHLHNFEAKFPLVFGHEGVSVVLETGSKVRNFRRDEVYASQSGRLGPDSGYTSMWSGMAEYTVIQDVQAMREDGIDPASIPRSSARLVPPEIDSVEASVLLTVKENYSALCNFGMTAGMDVLVFGDGPVGFGLVKLLRVMEAGYVACVGHHADRLAKIADAGADLCMNSNDVDIDEGLEDRKFDLVIDAVGKSSVLIKGASRLRPGGRLGAYGVLNRQDAEINLLDLPNNVLVHMLNFPHGEHDVHEDVVRLVLNGRIRLDDYYSHIMNVDDISEAVRMIQTRKAMKVLITFN